MFNVSLVIFCHKLNIFSILLFLFHQLISLKMSKMKFGSESTLLKAIGTLDLRS